MQTRLLVPLLSLVLGTAAGYFVGRSLNPVEAKTGAVAAGLDSEARQRTDGSVSAAVASAQVKAKADEKTKTQNEGESRFWQLDELVDDYSSKRAAKLMEGWSLEQIQAGLSYLATKPKTYEVSSIKGELYRAWAKTDANSAWQAALALTDNEGRSTCLGAIAGELAKTSPEAAIKMAMTLGMGSTRADVFRGLFREWGKVNMPAAVAYWNSHPDLPTDVYAISYSFYELAKNNPEQAAAQALTIASSHARNNSLSSALGQWARKDYDAALAWVTKIQDPIARDDALAAMLQNDYGMDPLRGLEALQLIDSPEKRREVQRSFISSWMRKDPAAAMDYLLREGADKLDENYSWSIGYALENLTTEERSSLLARLPEGKAKDQMMSNMATNYIYNGRYPQAVAALNSMPDSSERDGSLHNLGQQWGKKDPQTAANWINAQQDSSDRDLVVAGYATAVAARDPQAALQWAASIPDKSVQTTAYKNIVSRWYAMDAKAAQAWLNRTPIFTPEDRKRMLADAPGRSNSTYVPKVTNRR